MYTDNAIRITKIINTYFEGIFYGDIRKLKSVFTNNADLYGDIKGVEYAKSVDEYLEGVKGRQSPSELNEKNTMKNSWT